MSQKKKLDPRKVAQDQDELAVALGFKNRFEMQATFGFTARGISNQQAGLLGDLSGRVSATMALFRRFGDRFDSSPGGGLLGISDALRNIGGITQQYAATLINNGRAASTKSVSGTSKAQSGGFGGYKGTRFSDLLQALTYAYGPHTGYASNLTPYKIQQMINFIESEGVSLPKLSPLAGTYYTNHNETIRAFEAALAEANRRRSTRIEQQTAAANAAGISLSQYQSLSQTEQGRNDIAGMTLYKQLATLG